jgi:ABC-type amino acid transport substrate-binding protein
LCEATTATLTRRETMDFSIPTFVSGASLAIRPDGPTSVDALAGQKIGVLGGTTTQADLDITLKGQGITADVVVVHTHDEGFDLLKKGDITAYFADRTILQERLRNDPATSGLLLADNYLTIEPYALAMPIDHDFRLAVDRALSRLFRTGGMIKVFRGSFDPEAKPSELLKALSRMSALPE